MFKVGQRVYVKSEQIPQGGHGYVVPTPGHYLSDDNVLMVEYQPESYANVAGQWALHMDGPDSDTTSSGTWGPTTVRVDDGFCPEDWVCSVCRRERPKGA
ncbi:hypothetical protein AB0E01_22960 [Nocardia vinacea]|uniref:hypothetical protein n=1 Tax=Nocardia vinacea TaxID=96468 RepID=UPI0033DCD649